MLDMGFEPQIRRIVEVRVLGLSMLVYVPVALGG